MRKIWPTRFIISMDCTVESHAACQPHSFSHGQPFVCACDCHRTTQMQLELQEVNHGLAVPESLGNTGAAS